ncbi:DNA polymerase eta-like isoform X2 [Oscarella lobularis]|uniref:DNA polymerase eta-like isoform X2 n=1 Tax=Oscarella lobularis TaxID=121494 RepID=UPI0033136144
MRIEAEAVDYEARKFGVKRRLGLKVDEARKQCPTLEIVRVIEKRGKADLTKYRKASAEVMHVLSRFGGRMERASIDEAYIELTETVDEKMKEMDGTLPVDQLTNTHVVGWDVGEKVEGDDKAVGVLGWIEDGLLAANRRLAVGACLVEEMRRELFRETGFACSAGISHNKVLSKLACGLHKPNQQTVCPMESVPDLFRTLPFRKIRNLGGKLGYSVEEQLGISCVGELCAFEASKLRELFGDKNGFWLYNVCRGLDNEPVRPRQLPKSIGCSKNFPGPTKLVSHEQVKYWLLVFAEEICERLDEDQAENNRIAKRLTVNCSPDGRRSFSRACPLTHYDASRLADDALAALVKGKDSRSVLDDIKPSRSRGPTPWAPSLVCLGMAAAQFEDIPSNAASRIDRFLSADVNPSESRPLSSTTLPSPRKRGTTTPNVSIGKFFRKTEKGLGEKEGEEGGRDRIACQECGKLIDHEAEQEHKDYHFALQLQKEARSAETSKQTPEIRRKTPRQKTKKQTSALTAITKFFTKRHKDEPA